MRKSFGLGVKRLVVAAFGIVVVTGVWGWLWFFENSGQALESLWVTGRRVLKIRMYDIGVDFFNSAGGVLVDAFEYQPQEVFGFLAQTEELEGALEITKVVKGSAGSNIVPVHQEARNLQVYKLNIDWQTFKDPAGVVLMGQTGPLSVEKTYKIEFASLDSQLGGIISQGGAGGVHSQQTIPDTVILTFKLRSNQQLLYAVLEDNQSTTNVVKQVFSSAPRSLSQSTKPSGQLVPLSLDHDTLEKDGTALTQRIYLAPNQTLIIKPKQNLQKLIVSAIYPAISSVSLQTGPQTSSPTSDSRSDRAQSTVPTQATHQTSYDVTDQTATVQAINTTTQYNTDQNSGAKYSTLPIISRKEWGASPQNWDATKPDIPINGLTRLNFDLDAWCRWEPEYYRTSRIVIHHTVTQNYPNDPYRAVREVYLFHAYSRGWGDIGYNYLIDSQGRIFEGKIGGEGVKGYHAFEAANEMSISIALIGDFTYTLPTTAQQQALAQLLAEKAALFGFDLKLANGALSQWLDTTYTVFGHRHTYKWIWDTNSWEINATACPGERLVTSGTLASIVTQAQNLKNTGFAAIKQARSTALDMLNQIDNGEPLDSYTLKIVFNNATTLTRDQILEKLPKFSGIQNIYVGSDNNAYVTVSSNVINESLVCGYKVPPIGWKGYDDCGSHGCQFFPASRGARDRVEVLLTVLLLRDDISSVTVLDRADLGSVQ